MCCVLLLLVTVQSFAEGSKELSANGGYRAFLFSSTAGNSSFPFPTLGTMKVYAKAGETIYVGSSGQGIGAGKIDLLAPDGATYTSDTSKTIGLIKNRQQELAGPLPNPGGYKPFTVTVKTGQEGIWEVDFISQSNGVDLDVNPNPVAVNANWTQPNGIYITAFDVSVRNATNSAFIPGRVYTNVFSGILGTFNVGFNAILNILTKDGYQYTFNNNGQAGNGFTFFVNNKGFRGTNNVASYQSIDDVSNANVQDPRGDDSEADVTQKIFFNKPAADLPATANSARGTTWLLTNPTQPTVTDVAFTGTEGTTGKGGTNPLGGNFNFTSSGSGGTYSIIIDVNKNGVFTDAADRTLTGLVSMGVNTVYWDGLDGENNKVPADTLAGYKANISVTTNAGEVHFPFFDVERNVNGIKLTRTNGSNSPDYLVYWDDTPITVIGTPSNPVQNLKGISSITNGHKWGAATNDALNDADFGNNRGIDTWAYITNAPIVSTVNFKLEEADLEIDSIMATGGCAGQQVIYNVTVKNNGPDNVTGAKFSFKFPVDIANVVISSASTTGASAVNSYTIADTAYNANVDIADGAVRTFTITGKIAQSATSNFVVTASIMRPADVTDPDATNPDAAPPTNPNDECNSIPSGIGCNNIKTNSTGFIPTPNAGPDQTVYQNVEATISATGIGTWSQAIGDPVMAHIANPANSSTTVSGLNTAGVYHFVYTNPNSCTDTVALTVVVTNTIIPNIFTPNNDGKNDVFKIAGLEAYKGSQLIIFNRWGNEVYRADNYLNDWNGSNLAEGTYYYLLNRREHNGSITTFKGWVFLKRSK